MTGAVWGSCNAWVASSRCGGAWLSRGWVQADLQGHQYWQLTSGIPTRLRTSLHGRSWTCTANIIIWNGVQWKKAFSICCNADALRWNTVTEGITQVWIPSHCRGVWLSCCLGHGSSPNAALLVSYWKFHHKNTTCLSYLSYPEQGEGSPSRDSWLEVQCLLAVCFARKPCAILRLPSPYRYIFFSTEKKNKYFRMLPWSIWGVFLISWVTHKDFQAVILCCQKMVCFHRIVPQAAQGRDSIGSAVWALLVI